jgi:hypothetical protein
VIPELLDRLQPFREEALNRGIPSEDLERWVAAARPSGTLVTSGEGPVVGRYGGALMLPADAPDPWYPLLATLDCAALPEEVTGLPLPPDGHLLLFGVPELPFYSGSVGEVMYVPAGTPVEERETKYAAVYGSDGDEYDDDCLRVYEEFPQGELHLVADVTLPFHSCTKDPEPPYDYAPLPGHPRAGELVEAWDNVLDSVIRFGLRIGGFGFHECTETDPVVDAAQDAEQARRFRLVQGTNRPGDDVQLPAPEDWVLLAQWGCDITGREGATLHWAIPRQDLIVRRFDRTHVSMFWNP